MTNRERAPKEFFVDRPSQHARLAQRCLEVMEEHLVKDNICDLPPNEDYDSVADLAGRRQEHIPQVLEYACRHWAYHLHEALKSRPQSDLPDAYGNLLHSFTSKLMLRWIDVLAVTRNLDQCLPILIRARESLSVSDVF